LIFCTILLGSMSAAISRTLAAATSMSTYWELWELWPTIVNWYDSPDILPCSGSQASTEAPKAQQPPL
jgi:hypothetical protein